MTMTMLQYKRTPYLQPSNPDTTPIFPAAMLSETAFLILEL